ncbi:immunoglobulin E-set domain-containing protein [Tieghemostelium lacteum]|uniref:Immunoglobulin E-set domain-containing protein n=1 Tax=Tieghemostelium lacteum TaxID=361077 RepID=A0A152A1W2_TIELA|nr:immunoglobulin E-set domain-containing protein [Tieghemostelium lacteum]|eukprot:KYR00243.1 immunoglobulin E-set domain-containing protein [Tieghemostelium lacteum]
MKYIILLYCLSLISPIFTQISVVNYEENSETYLKFRLQLASTDLVNITKITTDFTNQTYIPSCIKYGSSINCSIELLPSSQTERYFIYDENHPTISTSIFVMFKKFNLLVVSTPKPNNNSILRFSGLYFQPYPIFNLVINITNLNETKSFNSLLGNITFINSTSFEIDVGDSVGEIEYSMTDQYITLPIYKTSYQGPIIESVKFLGDNITITGDNFGNSKFSNYSNILINSISQNQTSYLEYSNNKVILKSISIEYFSNSYDFDFFIANISTLSSFKVLTKPKLTAISNLNSYSGGEVTVTGENLNCKRQNGTSSDILIKMGNKICSSPTNIDDVKFTTLKCTMPQGFENDENLPISLSIDSVQADIPPFKFTYYLPKVTKVEQDINNTITILGDNFDNSQQLMISSNFTLNSKVIKLNTIANCSKSSLILSLPQLFNDSNILNGDIIVYTPYSKSTNPIPVKLIPSIQEIKGIINKNGGIITIIGKYLNMKRFNNENTVLKIMNLQNNTSCYDPSQNNDNNIICTHLPTTSVINNIIVSIDGKQSITDIKVEFQSPIIHSFEYQSEISSIILKGENFGNDQSLIQIKIGNTILTPDQYSITQLTFEKVEFQLVSLKTTQDITIIVNQQISNSLEIYIPPKPTERATFKKSQIDLLLGILLPLPFIAVIIFLILKLYTRSNVKKEIKRFKDFIDSTVNQKKPNQ